MKRLIIAISAVILLFAGVIFFANNESSKSTSDKTNVTEVVEPESIALSEEIKSSNGQLIDVREPSEYVVSHADGAVNIPLGNILNADYSKIDSDRPIYLICRSGNRAEQAKTALEAAGYKNVKNIGGLVDWENQGAKVCSSSSPSCT